MQNSHDIDFFITDLNGNLRGKRLPKNALDKVFKEGIKLPRSVVGIDFWGEDVAENGLLFETGDNDGQCIPIGKEAETVPWAKYSRQQIHAMMHEPDGSAFLADPRQILKHITAQLKQSGYTPVVATELEFYLLKQTDDLTSPVPAQTEMDGYSITLLDELEDFFTDMRSCCQQLGIPADAIISEIGSGQFEINLKHQADPLLAADQTLKFKRLVKGVAKNHDFDATFMAKPFTDKSGNGFHTHFSLLDANGNNVFDDGTENGSTILLNAVAGLLEIMPESMLLFAPHLNSYKRLAKGTHAPTLICWGYDNRTTAVRIPESPAAARRIEHRVAGADANPYLVIAAILAGALYGIEQGLLPEQATSGNAYENDNLSNLPNSWSEAIDIFTNATLLPKYLGELLIPVYSAIKKQEFNKINGLITDVEYQAYLGRL